MFKIMGHAGGGAKLKSKSRSDSGKESRPDSHKAGSYKHNSIKKARKAEGARGHDINHKSRQKGGAVSKWRLLSHVLGPTRINTEIVVEFLSILNHIVNTSIQIIHPMVQTDSNEGWGGILTEFKKLGLYETIIVKSLMLGFCHIHKHP